jgi:polar amino acid transport system substrate-binding protein
MNVFVTMRRYLTLACLLVLLTGCADKKEPPESGRTVLRVGTDATYPPFEMINTETGKPQGFDIDLMDAICQVEGWTPEFVVTPFDGIIAGLTNHKYDAVISAMTITPQRSVVVDFSHPYYAAGQTIAVPLTDSTTKSTADLRGKRVGVQLGTTGELMAKRLEGVEVFSYDNIGAAFIDMANGNLDAVLNDYPTTLRYIKVHHDAKTVGKLLSSEFYGIAVRKNDSGLLNSINEALDSLKRDGTFKSIQQKWFGDQPELNKLNPTGDSTGD